MKLYLERKTIMGCRDNESDQSPFLTRYTLARLGRWGNLYIHHFHRSDNHEHHCHPWNFVSLILWGGYFEHTLDGRRRCKIPGMILVRPATWAHWTELRGKSCITLIWVSARKRTWGFYTREGWIPFDRFFHDRGCDEIAKRK